MSKRGVPHEIAQTYRNIIQRCYYPKDKRYSVYGGAGIKVCEKWRVGGVWAFYGDVGNRPPGKVLGRIDVSGDFAPDNVRWMILQCAISNRRTVGRTPILTPERAAEIRADWGKKLTMQQLATEYRVKRSVIANIIAGYSITKPEPYVAGKKRPLTYEQAEEIRRRWKESRYITYEGLAKKYGVSVWVVGSVISGKGVYSTRGPGSVAPQTWRASSPSPTSYG